MNGCECIVSFDEYNAADTIGFTVIIKRDDEVFYEKHGSVPLLNKNTDSNLVNHIKVDAVINDSDIETEKKIEIFYTYFW